jgi:hypothetical protein
VDFYVGELELLRGGHQRCYVQDPDGIIVELEEQTE